MCVRQTSSGWGPFMSMTKSRAMDLRPAARAAQRLFTANQILFVIALVFGVSLGILVIKQPGDFARSGADDAVRGFLLGGLFVYALLFALMDYARRYWIGVALAAALVMMAIVLGTVIAIGQQSEDHVLNVLGAVLVLGPIVLWFALQLAASWQLLRQNVAPLGRPLTLVDQRIRELAHSLAGAGHAAKPRFPWLGPMILIVSLAGIGVTILIFLTFVGAHQESPTPKPVDDVAALGFLTLPFWALLLQLGRKLSRPDAATLLEADERAPIVLLRSFQDDEKSVKRRSVLARFLFWGFGGRIRLEQAIAGELSRFGPFVAIGEPGERLPDLGAARAYFSNDEWQAAALDWIRRARTIVIIGGMTRWVTWELRQVIASGKLDHLVLLLPPDTPAGRAARWQLIAEALRGSHWRAALEGIDTSHAIALCQKPGTNDEIIVFSSAAPRQVDYEIAIRLAVYAMHAVGKPTIDGSTHLSTHSRFSEYPT
jgi:hypothetical protein